MDNKKAINYDFTICCWKKQAHSSRDKMGFHFDQPLRKHYTGLKVILIKKSIFSFVMYVALGRVTSIFMDYDYVTDLPEN